MKLQQLFCGSEVLALTTFYMAYLLSYRPFPPFPPKEERKKKQVFTLNSQQIVSIVPFYI